jgi:hypothetical protein
MYVRPSVELLARAGEAVIVSNVHVLEEARLAAVTCSYRYMQRHHRSTGRSPSRPVTV